MLKAKCIQKFRDKNNNIICYRLQDCNGYTKDVIPKQLKIAIKNGQITITNLTLTSDNRLVDTTQTQQTQPKQQAPQISDEEQKIKNLIAKTKLLGLPLKEIPACFNTKCYILSQSPTQHLIYIPDDVTRFANGNRIFTEHIVDLQGTIKVVGGKNIANTHRMFSDCQAQSIDLSSFNTSNVTDMKEMFRGCQAQSIDLSSFNTSNVTDMSGMFTFCRAQSIDLRSFNTSNVTDMSYMFSECTAKSIDLSSFNTSNVTDMHGMFESCQAKSIDLSSFDTSNVTEMSYMFQDCQAQSIGLSSFNTSNVTDMAWMFQGCKAKIKATDNKILEYIK